MLEISVQSWDFLRVFQKRSSKDIILKVCYCQWDYKSASTSVDRGMECENQVKDIGTSALLPIVKSLKSLFVEVDFEHLR